MPNSLGTSFGKGWGTEVILTKSGGEANLPNNVTAYMGSTPLQNGKYLRTLYLPALTDAPVALTGTTTYYTIPANSLMGVDNILTGSTGDVVPIVCQASGGAWSVAPNTDFAFIDKLGRVTLVTSARTALIENVSLSNFYSK